MSMSLPMSYTAQRPSTSRFIALRGLNYHVRTWGTPDRVTPERPALVLAHGWMDVGASFQFMVDALDADRYVIALDWRGFGLTTGPATDSYWFPDYLGDLDALLDALLPDQQIDLLGHSMGGNVVMIYAGARPERIRRLVNLEGFGMPPSRAAQAPGRYAKWLDELKAPQHLSSYTSLDGVAARLRKNNPRLREDYAAWLAPHWAAERDDGRFHILGDAAHKRVNPQLYRRDEAMACFARITAPVLWVEGRQTDITKWWGDSYPRADFDERMAVVPQLQRVMLEDCGHMLHHDQPQALAAHLQDFLR